MTPPDDKNFFAENVARYRIGQLVHHRRYDYRGVIVDFDMRCQATDAWYLRNRTQPDRDQPWYHVLVDGSMQTTYAAEESLEPDTRPDPIRHPLITRFFDAWTDGRYERNDEPWPG